MNLDTVYRKDSDTVTRDIAGETLLVPIRGRTADMGSIYALNPTARFIWEGLDGTRTLGDILAGLIRRFDVTDERARADLEEFIHRLKQVGIIGEKT